MDALATGHVTMRSDGPEKTRFVQACDPTMVIRKVEGRWKLAVISHRVLPDLADRDRRQVGRDVRVRMGHASSLGGTRPR